MFWSLCQKISRSHPWPWTEGREVGAGQPKALEARVSPDYSTTRTGMEKATKGCRGSRRNPGGKAEFLCAERSGSSEWSCTRNWMGPLVWTPRVAPPWIFQDQRALEDSRVSVQSAHTLRSFWDLTGGHQVFLPCV